MVRQHDLRLRSHHLGLHLLFVVFFSCSLRAPRSPPGCGPGGPPHGGFPGHGPSQGEGEYQGPPRLTEAEEEAAELEVEGEEEEEECDLESYLDSQDWSRWVGKTEEERTEVAVGEQVVLGE
jgi:hypothetical protein